MPNVKILFLHGKEGTPEGTKPEFLKANGYRIIAPVLPKDNWGLSLQRAMDCFNNFKPDIVIGSSRGGAIAAAIPTGDVPKILIAPAYVKFGVTEPVVDETTTVLHCRNDELVPYEDSEKLAKTYQCELIACGVGHRMSDTEALSRLRLAVEEI